MDAQYDLKLQNVHEKNMKIELKLTSECRDRGLKKTGQRHRRHRRQRQQPLRERRRRRTSTGQDQAEIRHQMKEQRRQPRAPR